VRSFAQCVQKVDVKGPHYCLASCIGLSKRGKRKLVQITVLNLGIAHVAAQNISSWLYRVNVVSG
jgi:hypothetical protein